VCKKSLYLYLKASNWACFTELSPRGSGWISSLIFVWCWSVTVFGTHLLRNCWTDLAEILHRDGGLPWTVGHCILQFLMTLSPSVLKPDWKGGCVGIWASQNAIYNNNNNNNPIYEAPKVGMWRSSNSTTFELRTFLADSKFVE